MYAKNYFLLIYSYFFLSPFIHMQLNDVPNNLRDFLGEA